MSRPVSDIAKQAIFSSETSEVFVILLTITHADLQGGAIRVCSNSVDVVHGNDTYLAYPFELQLPPQSDDRPPVASLRIDNVHRLIVENIRSINSAPTVQMEIVRVEDDNGTTKVSQDGIEASFDDFRLRNVSYDALTVEGELSLEHFIEEPYPSRVFSPTDFPGMF